MNLYRYMDILLEGLKNLKRNKKVTIFSWISICIVFLVFGLFLIYIEAVNENASTVIVDNMQAKDALKIMGFAAVIILLPILLSLVLTSFKMSVYSRQNEIRIMKAIGATDWYIRGQFIVEGVIIGILGAILGCFLLFYLYTFIFDKAMGFTEALKLLKPNYIFEEYIFKFIILGIIVCPVGNIIALRKELK